MVIDKLEAKVPVGLDDISKFNGAVIVTLAVKSDPFTSNVVGVDEAPEHDVSVPVGLLIEIEGVGGGPVEIN